MTGLSQNEFNALISAPIQLSFDNFTPLSRTPWAGKEIYRKLKKELFSKNAEELLIGESWEFSCDTDFPSKILGTNITVNDLIQEARDAILGSQPNCQLLVKLVNALYPLSVQVHPDDNCSLLKKDECGKPESWLVIDAKQGSGIYVGFKKLFQLDQFEEIFKNKAEDFLQFVQVQPGDYFELNPGVVHAVGADVLLFEPQRILPGKHGKTFRLWDWGRKFDQFGNIDMVNGKQRDLHLEEAKQIIDPSVQVGETFIQTVKKQPEKKDFNNFFILSYPPNKYFQLRQYCFMNSETVTIESSGYMVLFVVEGSVSHKNKIMKGQTTLLPNYAMPLNLKCEAGTKFILCEPTLKFLELD